MPQTCSTDLLVIGAGPAGYTAAIYAARANLSPVLVAGLQPGGQLMITTDVENYPGFARGVQGPDLMMQMAEQAGNVGTRLMDDIIVSCDFTRADGTGRFYATGDSGTVYEARSVIIATGAQAKWLGVPGEKEFQGSGVSACATCDGFFYRGKRVAVVGGGNTAVEEALYLTHHASHVTLIHRRDSLRAEKILQDRLHANPKISVIWNSAVERITGSGTPPVVTGADLRNTVTGAMQHIDVDGVFVAIGHAPTPQFSVMWWRSIQTVTSSPRRAAPAPPFPAFLPQVTCRTRYIGRLSLPRAPAAWQRSRPSVFLPRVSKGLHESLTCPSISFTTTPSVITFGAPFIR